MTWLLLPLLLPVRPAVAAPAWEIEGKGHEGHPGFPALRRRADEALGEALSRLRDALASRPGEVPIRWVLEVSPAPTPAAREFFKAASTTFAEGQVRVALPARKYLRRPDAVRAVIAHEAAHAVMASLCGTPERYRAVPAWFREGVALWFSQEGDGRVRETLAYMAFQGKPAASFLEGISFAVEPAEDAPQAESYLAIRWVEGRLGKAGIRDLCLLAAEGKSLEAGLTGVLAMTSGRLQAELLLSARHEVEKLLSLERERSFRDVLRRREEGKDFAPAARRCLEEDPGGPLSGTLRYLLARALARPDDLPAAVREARRHLEELLGGQDHLWRPESLVLLGQLLWRCGEKEKAKSLWMEVLEAYGEDPAPAAQARKCLQGS